MRHLATVQEVTGLHPIEGKDRIVLADVLGWHVIVKSDEFNVGDQCVYIEIDSVLPPKPEFEFLAKKDYRIKTMKMGGVVSQGICFPMSILPEGLYHVGGDVTELLGVTQYEPDRDDYQPSDSKKTKRKLTLCDKLQRKFRKDKTAFPTNYIHKTDETRIQSAPFLLDSTEPWVVTEKVDGSSGTFLLIKHGLSYEFIVCSRNRRIPKDDCSIYWEVAKKYRLKDVLTSLIGKRKWIAIQGECIGPRIQGNKYGVNEAKFYAFNLIDYSGRKNSVQARDILGTRGIDFVPIIDPKFVLPKTVDEMMEYSTGQSVIGDTLREGVVVRSQDGKQSFKAVSPEFLLKYKL